MRYLGHKPSPSHLPITHDALSGNLQHFCRFLHAELSEKSEFDDFGFARVNLSQGIHGFVDGDNLAVPGARGDFRYVVQMIGALKQTAAHGTQNGKLAKCIVGDLHLHLYWSRHILLGHKEP